METKFFTTKRGGETALWVNVDGDVRNIWDIPNSVATPDVLNAIRFAFEVGSIFQAELSKKAISNGIRVDREWEEA